MHSKSDNIEIMINDEADEIMKNLFDSLKSGCQSNLESMKGTEFVFDYVHLLYYKSHKINSNNARSYIDSADWINPVNKNDNKCLQYAVTVALNYEEIGKNPEKITEIKPFLSKYKWERLNFPSEKGNWKNLLENNVTIALNVLLYAKIEKIYQNIMF